jgi:type IV pilus assembly protein PilV
MHGLGWVGGEEMHRCRTSHAHGFAMLEALVAVLVLAIGVLGVVGLLLTSQRFSQQSSFDTVAMHLASDLADKMRANLPASQTANPANNPYLFDTATMGVNPIPPQNFYSTPCTDVVTVCAPLLARFDVDEWVRRARLALPGARAVVCRDDISWQAAGFNPWACAPAGGAGTAPIVIKLGWVERRLAGQARADVTDVATRPQLVIVALP